MKQRVAAFLVLLLLAGCTPKTVSRISVTNLPDKVWYTEGETFDPAGMAISAVYSDGSEQAVTDYTVDPSGALTPEVNSVKVTAEGKSTFVSITVDYLGNGPDYSVENMETLSDSPLQGKTIFFLGSSVTFGDREPDGSGTSMAEFLAKRDGCTALKEAVSGTTLAWVEQSAYGKNYTDRLDDYLALKTCVEALDAFVCQLSTNDASQEVTIGSITPNEERDADAFDRNTTCGAMEYIVATVTQRWGCPVVFYTNSRYESETYPILVERLYELAEKWDITVIDLWTDEAFNTLTDAQRTLYLKPDGLHPTKAGYRDWWLPVFETVLKDAIS